MSRIRSIKPEFPQSETVGRLSRDARLLWIMLWTIVDDAGRARASSRMLASLLYPYDDDARGLIESWLVELEMNECIRRYEHQGKLYLDIPNWLTHQKIGHPTPSKLPEFTRPHEPLTKLPEVLTPDLDRKGRDKDLDLSCRIADATRPLMRKQGEFEKASEAKFDEFWQAYPKRAGTNSKKAARLRFIAAVKAGADPNVIIAGARAYTAAPTTKVGTEFVMQAETWLNKRGWEQYGDELVDRERALEEYHRSYMQNGGTNAKEGTADRDDPGLGDGRPGDPEELRSQGRALRGKA